MTDEIKEIGKTAPDRFVMPGSSPKPERTPTSPLVFVRDRNVEYVHYRAKIDLSRNGTDDQPIHRRG